MKILFTAIILSLVTISPAQAKSSKPINLCNEMAKFAENTAKRRDQGADYKKVVKAIKRSNSPRDLKDGLILITDDIYHYESSKLTPRQVGRVYFKSCMKN